LVLFGFCWSLVFLRLSRHCRHLPSALFGQRFLRSVQVGCSRFSRLEGRSCSNARTEFPWLFLCFPIPVESDRAVSPDAKAKGKHHAVRSGSLLNPRLKYLDKPSQPALPTQILWIVAIGACGNSRSLALLGAHHRHGLAHEPEPEWTCLALGPFRRCLIGGYKAQGFLAHAQPSRY